jgi:hypothetical protein
LKCLGEIGRTRQKFRATWRVKGVFKGFDQGFDQTLTMSWPSGVIRVCRWCFRGDGPGWPSFDQSQHCWPDH